MKPIKKENMNFDAFFEQQKSKGFQTYYICYMFDKKDIDDLSNAEYIEWINKKHHEFKKEKGAEFVDKLGSSYTQEFTNWLTDKIRSK